MAAHAISNPFNAQKPYFECHRTGMEFYESASQRFQYDVVLECTPEKLFEVFEDENSWPVWAPGIAKVDWTSPKPYGVGTTRTVTFVGGMEVYEEFIAWEPGKEMAFIFQGITQDIWWSFGEHYRVVDMGSGRCKLTWTVAYEPRGTFAKLSGGIRPVMWLALKSFMSNLQKYCRDLPR
jgi:hypothetical protein